MNKRYILIIGLILCLICSISAVMAADSDTNSTQDDFVQSTEVNDVSVNDTLASSNNPEKLNAADDSFTALQDKIRAGGVVTLDQNYNYNSADDSGLKNGITGSKGDITLYEKDFIIDTNDSDDDSDDD